MDITDIQAFIRDIANFPAPGITFRDITPLLGDPQGLRGSLDMLADLGRPMEATAVVGIESRGFLFGVPVADRLGLGFAPMRKPGKLPFDVISQRYELEYGSDTLELHIDAVGPGDRVLIVDDVLATGGTAAAAVSLVQAAGAAVAGCLFLVELDALGGRCRLGSCPVASLLTYP